MGDFLFGESFFLKEHDRKTFIVCDSKKRSCVAGFGLRCLFVACSSSVLRTLFCGPPRFASRASDCAASSRRARPRCFAPFFAARPASRRGLRTALPLRGVLVLGASPPFLRPAPLRVAGFGLRCLFAACSSLVLRTLFCGPPRFAPRASDCAASSRRARPRCFAPLLRPAPLFSFPCPFLGKEKPPARLFRRPGACLSWLTFSPFSGQCRESGKSSSRIRCR